MAKPNDMKDLIVSRLKGNVDRTLFIEGPPGCGKTEITAQAAKELGQWEEKRPSQTENRQVPDFTVTVVDAGSGATQESLNNRAVDTAKPSLPVQ